MDVRKIYFGIEKKFWFFVGLLAIVGAILDIPLIPENRNTFDWVFWTVMTVFLAGIIYLFGWLMTKENTSSRNKMKAYYLEQEQIDKACRDQLRSFVQRFNPVGEIVLEGDFPDLTASFNDQSGKRHEILLVGDEFFEKIC